MTSRSTAEEGSKPKATWPHPALQAGGSALLLWTTFPPANWGWLAWIALVPLFLLVKSRGERSARSVYFGAWLGGVIFWSLAIQWVRLTDESAWLGWLAMVLALSAFWPLFLWITRLAVLRLRLPLMVAAPVVWVALEYARAYFATGFPWYYLAHSQHQSLGVIQISDWSGSLGVSFLIAVVNAWLVELLTQPLMRPTAKGARLTTAQGVRLGAVLGMLGLTLGYGAFRLSTAKFLPGPRVALLQSSLIQRYKESKSAAEIIEIYRRLVFRGGGANSDGAKRPDLIVWPETSYPYGFVDIDPGMEHGALAAQVREVSETFTVAGRIEQRDRISADLHNLTDQVGIPMLVGSLTYEHRPAGMSKFNSAILFKPREAKVESYHKLHLVPFGEYVPLIGTFPWLTVFTPYSGTYVPSLNFGRGPVWLDLGAYRLAVAICFEDTLPQVVREFFQKTSDGRQPDVLVNLSNDGWFHGSSEHDMHLAVSVFRCVENRVPLIRAANTGISAIVDGNGRVLKELPKLQENVLVGEVPLDNRVGMYSVWGDWLGRFCLAVTIGFLPLGYFWRRGLDVRVS